MSRNWYEYTEPIPAMVVRLDDLVPADKHPPLVLESVVGANQNVCGSECHIAVCLLQKLAYTAYDFTDLGVALSRSFMPWEIVIRRTEMTTVRGSRSMVNKSERG